MDNSCKGPCLSHCFKCPYGVVITSNMALAITFSLIVTIILNIKQEKLEESFTLEQRKNFMMLRFNILKTFVSALLLALGGIILWKPFTPLKMA